MINKKHVHHHVIRKASGDLQDFSERKYKTSLKKSGLNKNQAIYILKKVAPYIKDGMSTRNLYRKTLPLIKSHSSLAAVNYTLKKSLFDLGPNGFIFEKFMERYFKAMGFKVQRGQFIKGKCAKHEVDLIITHNGRSELVECKFHNSQGRKNDIKTALYIKARCDDILSIRTDFFGFWLVSNTGFTKDAISYSLCANINLIGVNTPKDSSLIDDIKRLKLYPVTTLKILKKQQIRWLLENDILTLRELDKNIHRLPNSIFKDDELFKLSLHLEMILKGEQ